MRFSVRGRVRVGRLEVLVSLFTGTIRRWSGGKTSTPVVSGSFTLLHPYSGTTKSESDPNSRPKIKSQARER